MTARPPITRPAGIGFDVYRNGTRTATVRANAYTDSLDKKGSGTYTYKVCACVPAAARRSGHVTVSFSPRAAISRAARPPGDSRAHGGRRDLRPIRTTHGGKKR
jgi:hypothetical protein